MALSVLPKRDELGIKQGRLFIDGQWRDASDAATWTHVHPATAEEIGSFAVATPADVAEAVGVARRVFDEGEWPNSRAKERITLLRRIAQTIRDHADELAGVKALDNGIPTGFGAIAYAGSMEIVADIFDHHAGWVDKLGGQTLPSYQGTDKLTMTFRDPVGVVGAVIPWNAPLMLFAQTVAPALATGCTVVLKPSEYATFSVLRLVELMQECGLRDGVLNVVTGPGDPTGEALITDPRVDKLTFTGSRAVGSRVAHAAAERVARVSLELGGKSPLVIFEDCPSPEMAAATAMGMVTFGVSGQGCVCNTRALVHRSIYDRFMATAEQMAAAITYGDPFDPATNAAPLINARQLERVTGLIDRAKEEGARLVAGGDRPGGDLANGHYVNPTLFADVDNTSTIAQTEVFGPVLVAIPFDDEDEAIGLANQTEYGLGASIFSTDLTRVMRTARALRAGTIGVNGFMVEPHAPFGGFKASGLGREGALASIEAYTELKTVMVPFTTDGVM